MPTVFDGEKRPRLTVTAAFGGTLDPGPTYLHLGVGPGLGTGLVSGVAAGSNDVDITADVRSISISQRGRDSDIDTAQPVTASIVLSNRHGNYDPSNPASPYNGQLEDGVPVRVRMSWDGVAYDRFYGELADIQVDLDLTPDAQVTFTCADGLEKLGRAYLPEVSSPVRDGDTTGERIGWLADEAAWPSSLRSIETGYTTLARSTLGESAMELMARAEATEFGLLFVDGAGRLTFFDRHHPTTAARSTASQATFGDPGGAIGIQQLQLSRSRGRSFNRVAITRDPAPDQPVVGGGDDDAAGDGDVPVEQVADDPVTQGTKGVLGFPTQVGQLLRNDSDALALAQYLVERFKDVANRIREVQVNALRGNWDDLLPLGPLDRVTVTRDYGPNTVSVQLHIQGVGPEEIQVSPPAWNLTFSTSNPPAASSLWLVGSSQVGVDQLGW